MNPWNDLLEGRLAIPLSPRAVWKFTGRDRVRYLNGQVTNDVAKLVPGRALHAAVCNAKGKMEGEVWITPGEDCLWVDAPMELRESLGARLERYIIADDVTMEDVSDTMTGFHFLRTPEGSTSPAIASSRFGFAGKDVWNTEPGTAPWPLAPDRWVEACRIHQGIPAWGREMTPHTLPPEAALDRDAISYSKGCYIGQEVIARIKSKGHVNKKLARLTGTGNTPDSLPLPLIADGKEAGTLTSACAHPQVAGWIGLGLVKRELAEGGGPVEIRGIPASVLPV
ncbi:MAG: glycine cleavage T C-terminal barrel domain-containing protein [Candidatus Methylacidiphilales bacterium]|nr:glycine cleavage T C-terminal barrel domain-containing protein [Candidatus Methylacidiphilales bacterium]